tara:strand:+ start:3993 stop:4241 length:249 start_codon:yes stop_codon:yes gene_type:complete
MVLYKVHMDLSLVINELTKFRLYQYNSAYPIVFVEANNPDDACFKSIYNLIQMIMSQDSSIEARLLCREIKNDIRVVKIESK